jgi:hypothetical protein
MIQNRAHQVGVSAGVAVLSLLMCLLLAWVVRRRNTFFALVTGCCAYIVAFFATYAAYISQKHYYSDHWMDCLHGLCVLAVIMGMLLCLCYLLKLLLFHDEHYHNGERDVDGWQDSMDNVQIVFFGMAAAFALTEFIRFVIAGKFPELKGMNYKTLHTSMERHMLLGWVVAVAASGGFIVWHLSSSHLSHRLSYGMHLLVSFLCSFLSMCIAWAFLDWGQWYMYEWTSLGPIFSRIVFALICSVVWIVGVCLLAAVRKANATFCHFFILALSLLLAWSWGEVFALAFDSVFSRWWAKPAVAFLVSALVIPLMALLFEHRGDFLPHRGHEPSHKNNAAHHGHEPRLHGHDQRLASPMPPLHTAALRPPPHRTASPLRSHMGTIHSVVHSPTRFRDIPASRIHTAPLNTSPLRYSPPLSH